MAKWYQFRLRWLMFSIVAAALACKATPLVVGIATDWIESRRLVTIQRNGQKIEIPREQYDYYRSRHPGKYPAN